MNQVTKEMLSRASCNGGQSHVGLCGWPMWGCKVWTLQSQHAIQVYSIALRETMVFFRASAAVLFVQKPFSFTIILFCR